MNINDAITSSVSSVSFSTLTAQEIRDISVLKITATQLLDLNNLPTVNGLYDARLGPIGMLDICQTCHLKNVDCPGHFGHIELPVPVLHPLFLRHLYELIRAMCIYCHHFKIPKADMISYLAKLYLIEHGFVTEADNIDAEMTRTNINPDEEAQSDQDNEQDDKAIVELQHRLTTYVEMIMRDADQDDLPHSRDSYKTGAAYDARRKLLRSIMASAMSKNFCGRCRAKTHRYRKEGYLKILEIALTPKQKQFNVNHGIQRPSLAALKRRTQREMTKRPHAQHTDNGRQGENIEITGDIEMDDASVSEARERTESPEASDSEAEGEDLMEIDQNAPSFIADGRISNRKKAKKPTKEKTKQAERFMAVDELQAHIRMLFMNESILTASMYGIHGPLHTSKSSQTGFDMLANPDMFFVNVVCVPPSRFRPVSVVGGVAMENPQNELLGGILSACENIHRRAREHSEIRAKLPTGPNGSAPTAAALAQQQTDQNRSYSLLLDSITSLQHAFNSLIDSSKNPTRLKAGKQNPDGVKQVLEKKEGLFRMNMMGKRVNFAARSVISPDINIETNEIGVPPVFAKKLTFPEPVTPHNIRWLQMLVQNGDKVHPGAVAVEDENGTVTSLSDKTIEQRVAMAQLLLVSTARDTHYDRPDLGLAATRTPQTFKKVHRHLLDGDIVILNRQPSLHKPSMMCHRVRVLKGEKTIRMHYANCNSYNADFDGDEMNMHFPQTLIAQAEARDIANTDSQYLVTTSGDPIRGLIQDHVVSGVHMTNKETFLNREEYHQLLFGALRPGDSRIITVPPAVIKPMNLWTGKQVITTVLKNIVPDNYYGLNLRSKSKTPGKRWGVHAEEDAVVFADGELISGILDKSQFGASAYGLVHSVYEIYGAAIAGRLLGILSRLFTAYLQMRGFTCGIDDLRLTTSGDNIRDELVSGATERGLRASMGYVQLSDMDPTSSSTQQHLKTRLEEVLRDDTKLAGLDRAMMAETSTLTSSIIEKCLPSELAKRFPENNMALMTVSGAKGSNVNVSQIACLLGQQALEGRRVPTMVSGKTLPAFKAFDTQPRAGGFVSQRFLTGIRPQEYYFHCMAGREGLIDTAVKTSRSGYLQRCLIKHLEGSKVAYDHTVRNSDGDVMQFYYGEDGLDVTKSKHLLQFDFAIQNYKSLRTRYDVESALQVLETESAVAHMKNAIRSLDKGLKYHLPTVMSVYNPARHFGSISESYYAQIINQIATNPGRLIAIKKKRRKAENWPDFIDVDKLMNPEQFRNLMYLKYVKSLIEPGEAVGLLASQGVGEPSTQMTLNTFHLAGHGAANVTLGIPRLREVLQNASVKPATPMMKIPFLQSMSEDQQNAFVKQATRLNLSQLVEQVVVKERLSSRSAGSRRRTYQVLLKLYPASEYREEYGTTEEKALFAIGTQFLSRMELAIMKSLKKIRKQLAAQQADIGHGHALMSDRGTAAEDGMNNEDGGGEADDREQSERMARDRQHTRQGQIANDMDLDEEGDFGDRKRVEQSRHDREYDSGSDDQDAEDDSDAEDAEVSDSDDTVDRLRKKSKSKRPDSDKVRQTSMDSDTIDSTLHVRARSPGAQAQYNRMQDFEEEALAGRKYVTAFEWDKQMGAYCKIDLEFGSQEPKLLLVGIIEQVCRDAVVRQIPDISRCLLTPASVKDPLSYCTTEGANMKAMWIAGYEKLDLHALQSNDIAGMLRVYGVEAARSTLIREVSAVFGIYGIGVDIRHLTLIADYMTHEGGYKPFNRTGMGSSNSPFLKASFETTGAVLTDTVLSGDFDTVQSPSASIVLGQIAKNGTGSFSVLADIEHPDC